jgi:hypothetical protein
MIQGHGRQQPEFEIVNAERQVSASSSFVEFVVGFLGRWVLPVV